MHIIIIWLLWTFSLANVSISFEVHPQMILDTEGRVLLVVGDLRASICFANGFDDWAASLICQYFSLSNHGYAVSLPQTTSIIAITDLHCNSSAETIFDCDSRHYDVGTDTCSNECGVRCDDTLSPTYVYDSQSYSHTDSSFGGLESLEPTQVWSPLSSSMTDVNNPETPQMSSVHSQLFIQSTYFPAISSRIDPSYYQSWTQNSQIQQLSSFSIQPSRNYSIQPSNVQVNSVQTSASYSIQPSQIWPLNSPLSSSAALSSIQQTTTQSAIIPSSSVLTCANDSCLANSLGSGGSFVWASWRMFILSTILVLRTAFIG